jgi:OOP family OmpA-OmpF porin
VRREIAVLKICVSFLLAALMVSTLSNTSHGAQPEGQFSVTPELIFTDGDELRLVDDEINGFGLSIGNAFSPNWSLEMAVRSINFSGWVPQDEFFLGADILRVFKRDALLTPYLMLGAGYLSNSGRSLPDRDNAEFSAGFGFLLGRAGKPNLRLQYRARRDGNTADLNDQLVSLGVQFPLGSPPAPVVMDTSGDSDGDGVPDDRDRCPNTAAGARVDANGCELDTDGDGVVDSRDRCPNTVAGARVDSNGCELDSDGDGVVDRLDRCPGTAAGVPVDIRGCEIKEEIRLPGVNFETNSDRLIGTTTGVLDEAAATLRKNPTLKVEVAGHTDSQGAAAYNQNLSERRAIAVRDYLIRAGADGANLSIRGYGESSPIADNTTAAGRAQNRRVVLRILE